MVAVALAFAASIAWGCSDFLGGLRAKRIAVAGVVTLTMVGGLATAAVSTAILGGAWPGAAALWPVVPSGIASLVAFATLYRALAIGPMSIVAPISATYPVVPVVAGLRAGERPTILQAVGMAIAVAGVVTAASEGSPKDTPTSNQQDSVKHTQPRVTRAGVVLALLAAMASGTMLTALDAASEADPYWALLGARTVSTLLLLAVLLTLRPAIGVRQPDVPALLGIGVLDTGATTLFAVASTLGYLSIVAVVASLFPVMTVILAHLVLHERLHPHQWLGVVAALSGVVLLSVG